MGMLAHGVRLFVLALATGYVSLWAGSARFYHTLVIKPHRHRGGLAGAGRGVEGQEEEEALRAVGGVSQPAAIIPGAV